LPRLENGSVSGDNPPRPDRVDLWVEQAISVKGRPDWIFVKVYTHGCQEKNMDVLLGDDFCALQEYLQDKYNDGKNYKLHYTSAREMYNIIKAAESGAEGTPGDYRDFIMKSCMAKR